MENNKIEELLRKIGSEQIPSDIEKIAEREFGRFSDKLKEQRHINFREYFMKTRLIKISVAAAIIIVVLVGIPFFKSSGPSITLAGVYQKMELIPAFSYSMTMTTKGKMIPDMPESQTDITGQIILSELGMKMELQTKVSGIAPQAQEVLQQMYMNFEDGKMYMLMPKLKQYLVMEFTEDLLEQTKQESRDPREMVKQMLECEYTSLGRKEINGVEVEGFETTDSDTYSGGMFSDIKLTLWVDVEKWLPVRMDMYLVMMEDMELEGYMDNFRWDVQVEASEFQPVIPEDYVSMTGDKPLKLNIDEQGAIEGLAFFAKAFGKYPESLNIMELIKEFADPENKDSLTEEGGLIFEQIKELEKQTDPNDPQAVQQVTQKILEIMAPVQSLGTFYVMLSQDKSKEPAYYGDVVTPADTDMVLMRWKTGEDEYRVIYGDLRAETVDGNVLAELESQIQR